MLALTRAYNCNDAANRWWQMCSVSWPNSVIRQTVWSVPWSTIWMSVRCIPTLFWPIACSRRRWSMKKRVRHVTFTNPAQTASVHSSGCIAQSLILLPNMVLLPEWKFVWLASAVSWVLFHFFVPCFLAEYNMIKNQLDAERFPPKQPGLPQRQFHELSADEQANLIKKRLNDYSKKVCLSCRKRARKNQSFNDHCRVMINLYCTQVYKKSKVTEESKTESTICMRENSFYIDTVRAFRDRRYIYKGMSLIIFIVFIPLSLFFVRKQPQDYITDIYMLLLVSRQT